MDLLKYADFGGQLFYSNVSSAICDLREMSILVPIAVPWRPGIRVICVPPQIHSELRKRGERRNRRNKNFTDHNEMSYFQGAIKCACLGDSVVMPDQGGLTSASENRLPGFKICKDSQILWSVGASSTFLACICQLDVTAEERTKSLGVQRPQNGA